MKIKTSIKKPEKKIRKYIEDYFSKAVKIAAGASVKLVTSFIPVFGGAAGFILAPIIKKKVGHAVRDKLDSVETLRNSKDFKEAVKGGNVEEIINHFLLFINQQ